MPQPSMDFAGKRVLVMGLGRFGGGVGVACFLRRRGARVLVTDRQPASKLTASVARLERENTTPINAASPITFRLGEHRLDDFTHADLIVVNPAVDPRHNQFLQAAAHARVPMTSEIRLLVQQLPNRRHVIGVTGTAGKSTVTAMIGHILQQMADGGWRIADGTEHPNPQSPIPNPQVWIGGNLGGSLLDRAHEIAPEDWVVLELSSFMLEGLREDRWSPHIAVVTNLSPNHLDRHGSLQAYAAAKQTILDFQCDHEGDIYLGGPGTDAYFTPRVTRQHLIDDTDNHPRISPDALATLAVPGKHNRINARLAAHAVAAALKLDDLDALTRMLSDFAGLPHRLQLVCEHAGVRYFNDSKSTTPQAALLAIDSFPHHTVHIILGGYDKGSDLTPLAHAAANRCQAIYTVGKTGDAIADAASGMPAFADMSQPTDTALPHSNSRALILRCHTIDHAIAQTAAHVRQGDVVLLSPACASWDQFDNFEKRGEAFVAAVLNYTTESNLAPPLPNPQPLIPNPQPPTPNPQPTVPPPASPAASPNQSTPAPRSRHP